MADPKNVEKRRAPRYSVLDAVQFAVLQSEVQASARISDISLTGCYIETKNPLSPGTQIRLQVTLGESGFQTLATVVRSEPNAGMGVMFSQPAPASF